MTGIWTVTITTADGKITGTASLKQTGDKVTGQIGPSADATISIRSSHREQVDSENKPSSRPDSRIRTCELTVGDEKGGIHPGRRCRQGNVRIRADQAIGRLPGSQRQPNVHNFRYCPSCSPLLGRTPSCIWLPADRLFTERPTGGPSSELASSGTLFVFWKLTNQPLGHYLSFEGPGVG